MMSSWAINATTMMNKRREAIRIFPSSTPGMFGWMAVYVHANKVTTQLKTIPHKVLVLLLGEEALTSRVGIVSLRLGTEARTDRMYNRRAQVMNVMVREVESVRLLIPLRFLRTCHAACAMHVS